MTDRGGPSGLDRFLDLAREGYGAGRVSGGFSLMKGFSMRAWFEVSCCGQGGLTMEEQ